MSCLQTCSKTCVGLTRCRHSILPSKRALSSLKQNNRLMYASSILTNTSSLGSLCNALSVLTCYQSRELSGSASRKLSDNNRQDNQDHTFYRAHGEQLPFVRSASERAQDAEYQQPLSQAERAITRRFAQHWSRLRDPRMHALNDTILCLDTIDQIVAHYSEYASKYRVPNALTAVLRIVSLLDASSKGMKTELQHTRTSNTYSIDECKRAAQPLLGFLERYCHSYWGFMSIADICSMLFAFARFDHMPRPKVLTAATEQLERKARMAKQGAAPHIKTVDVIHDTNDHTYAASDESVVAEGLEQDQSLPLDRSISETTMSSPDSFYFGLPGHNTERCRDVLMGCLTHVTYHKDEPQCDTQRVLHEFGAIEKRSWYHLDRNVIHQTEHTCSEAHATAIANQVWAMARNGIYAPTAFLVAANEATVFCTPMLLNNEMLVRLAWALGVGVGDSGGAGGKRHLGIARLIERAAMNRLDSLLYEQAVVIAWSLSSLRYWAPRLYNLVLYADPVMNDPLKLPSGTQKQLVALHRLIQKHVPSRVYQPPDLPVKLIQTVDIEAFAPFELTGRDPMVNINNRIAKRIRAAGFPVQRNLRLGPSKLDHASNKIGIDDKRGSNKRGIDVEGGSNKRGIDVEHVSQTRNVESIQVFDQDNIDPDQVYHDIVDDTSTMDDYSAFEGSHYWSNQVLHVPLALPEMKLAFQVVYVPGMDSAGSIDPDISSGLSIDQGSSQLLTASAAAELQRRGWMVATIDYREWTRMQPVHQQEYIRELAHGYAHAVSQHSRKLLSFRDIKASSSSNPNLSQARRIPRVLRNTAMSKLAMIERERKRRQVQASRAAVEAKKYRHTGVRYRNVENNEWLPAIEPTDNFSVEQEEIFVQRADSTHSQPHSVLRSDTNATKDAPMPKDLLDLLKP